MMQSPRPTRPLFAQFLPLLALTLPFFCAQISAADLDYYRDVYPFLASNCVPCHNKKTTKSGLNLESVESAKKGGESGAGLVPGKGGESPVFQWAAHQGESEMPPKNNKSGAVALTAVELELLKTWIDQGAKASTKTASRVALRGLPTTVQPIYSVAITNDGRYAACGRAGHLFLYDLATRQFISRISDPSAKDASAHRDLIQSVHFSPDGERLASGGFREVKIWRKEKVEGTVSKLEAATATVSTLSPDGRRFVVADLRLGVRVLDTKSGAVLRTLTEAPAAAPRILSVSPSGTSLAMCGEDGSLQVRPLSEEGLSADFSGHPGTRALSWAQDGRTLFTGGDDKLVRVYSVMETNGGKEVVAAGAPVVSIFPTSSPDQIVIASEDGFLRVFSLKEAKVLREIKTASPVSCAISADGSVLAVASSDGVVRLFAVATGKPGLELRGDSTTSASLARVEWEAARAALDVAYHTALIAKLDAADKSLDTFTKKANDAIATAKKELPDKQKALAPALKARDDAEKAANAAEAAIASAPDGKPDAALQAKGKEATTKLATAVMAANSAASAVSAAENHIKDGEEQLQHIAENKKKNAATRGESNAALEFAKKVQADAIALGATLKQEVAKTARRALAVAFSETGHAVAAVFSDGKQQVWATSSGAPLELLSAGGSLATASLKATGGVGFCAVGSDGSIFQTSSLVTWKLERVLGGESSNSPFVDRVSAVRFSPDSKMLAVGSGEPSRSGDILLWEIESGKLLETWKDRHEDTVLSLDFSPDGKWLASGGADKLARVTDVSTGKQIYLLEAHTHHVMGVAFRADTRVLATSGGDGVVNTWDLLSGERLKKIIGWNKEVTALQFLGSSQKIVTSSAENLVRIVSDDGTEVRAIARLPDFMQSAASASSGALIIGGGEDSALRLWDGASGTELAVFASP